VFAAFYVAWLQEGLNFSKIKEAFVKANYFWIFAAFVFGIMAYWFRAIRWNMFLEPMGYKISNSNRFGHFFWLFNESYHS
jgi:uncharacterized membrane protein YbhN (UPF0104 family)